MSSSFDSFRQHGIPTGFSWKEFLFPCCFEFSEPTTTTSFSSSSSSPQLEKIVSSFTTFKQRSATSCGIACAATIASLTLSQPRNHKNRNFDEHHNNSSPHAVVLSEREKNLFYDRVEAVFVRTLNSPSSPLLALSKPMWTIELFQLLNNILRNEEKMEKFEDNDAMAKTKTMTLKSLKFFTLLDSISAIVQQFETHRMRHPLFYGSGDGRSEKNNNDNINNADDDDDDQNRLGNLRSFLASASSNSTRSDLLQVHVATSLATASIADKSFSDSSDFISSSNNEKSYSLFVALVNPLFLDCNCKKQNVLNQLGLASLSLDEFELVEGFERNILSPTRKFISSLLSFATQKKQQIVDKKVENEQDTGYALTRKLVPFLGHFVVVVGVTKCKKYFVIWDPSSSSSDFCVVSVESLDKSRRIHSSGTDMEIIEVEFSVLM
jgi:hypothetical protein